MTPPLIAGVDVSTKLVAIVLLDAATGVLHSTLELRCATGRSDSPAMPRDAAYRTAADTLNACQHVYVEAPKGKYSVDVGNRALGALLAYLTVPVTLFVPTAWKKAAGMKGSAGKVTIADQARKVFPELTFSTSQDICDAACIAHAGYLS